MVYGVLPPALLDSNVDAHLLLPRHFKPLEPLGKHNLDNPFQVWIPRAENGEPVACTHGALWPLLSRAKPHGDNQSAAGALNDWEEMLEPKTPAAHRLYYLHQGLNHQAWELTLRWLPDMVSVMKDADRTEQYDSLMGEADSLSKMMVRTEQNIRSDTAPFAVIGDMFGGLNANILGEPDKFVRRQHSLYYNGSPVRTSHALRMWANDFLSFIVTSPKGKDALEMLHCSDLHTTLWGKDWEASTNLPADTKPHIALHFKLAEVFSNLSPEQRGNLIAWFDQGYEGLLPSDKKQSTLPNHMDLLGAFIDSLGTTPAERLYSAIQHLNKRTDPSVDYMHTPLLNTGYLFNNTFSHDPEEQRIIDMILTQFWQKLGINNPQDDPHLHMGHVFSRNDENVNRMAGAVSTREAMKWRDIKLCPNQDDTMRVETTKPGGPKIVLKYGGSIKEPWCIDTVIYPQPPSIESFAKIVPVIITDTQGKMTLNITPEELTQALTEAGITLPPNSHANPLVGALVAMIHDGTIMEWKERPEGKLRGSENTQRMQQAQVPFLIALTLGHNHQPHSGLSSGNVFNTN